MKNNYIPTVTIETGKAISINEHALCEIQADDLNLQLPFCLPGETVEFETVKYKKATNYYLKSITKQSLERKNAECKHFTVCGGCLLQHTNYNFYKEFKESIVRNVLQKNNLDPYVMKEIQIVPKGQRRRANLEAVKKGENLFMGFHKLKSHQIVDMKECHVLTPPLQEFLPFLRKALDEILESFQKAKIFLLEINGDVDVGIEIQGISELNSSQIECLKNIAIESKIARLQFRYRKNFKVIHETKEFKVNFGNLAVDVDPWAFLQASVIAEKWMQEIVLKTLSEKQHNYLLDLFSGRGTFSGILAKISQVDAFEGDNRSINVLKEGSVDLPINAFVRDLFENPLNGCELQKYTGVVIDPPRAGAQKQCENIAKSNIETVLYVSCNPETFARDIAILTQGGYILESVYPIDQFLWSSHLEVIGVLKKN